MAFLNRFIHAPRFAALILLAALVAPASAREINGLTGFDPPRKNTSLKEYLLTVGDQAAAIRQPEGKIQIFASAPTQIDGKPLDKLSTLQPAGSGFVRNQACWLSADLTPISACQFDVDPSRLVWTSRLGMTLISPRHVLMAKHNNIAGTEVVFVSAENRAVRRKMIDAQPVVSTAQEDDGRPVYVDFYVGLLEADIDKSIHGVDFARILPLDFAPSLRSGALAPFLPVMHTNQYREVLVLEWTSAGRRGFAYDLFFSPPSEIDLAKFYKPVRVGDSGSPIFTAINGQLVLLSVFHTPSYGSSIVAFRREIEAAMAALQQRNGNGIQTAYQLVEADCSGFVRPSS